MLKEIILAIQAYFEAHRFIKKHQLWKWIIIPGIIYTLLFFVGFYFFWTSANDAIAWTLNQLGVAKWLDLMHDSWYRFLFIVGQIFIHLLLLVSYFSLFKYVYLIVASPIFAYLSEKTANILTGEHNEISVASIFQDAIRGIRISCRNLTWQTVYMVTLFFLSLIPLVGWITPLIMIFIDCYFMGFSMLDYSSERNKINVVASIDLIGHHKGLAVGNGMVFYLFHSIPIVGWVLAPSYAVVAATLSFHHAKNNEVIKHNP
jgi:CysZ protein